jgi:hypothetical protein
MTSLTILPFLNLVNRFKFLVNLNWINQQAAMGIDNAPANVHQLHTDYIKKKFPGGVNPLANNLDGLFGRKPKSPALIKEAGTKYILLSLWRHHVSEEAKWVKREANTVAYKMSQLQVDEYPLAPPPPLTHHDPLDPILQFEEEDDFSSQGSAGHPAPRQRHYPVATCLWHHREWVEIPSWVLQPIHRPQCL